VASVFDRDRASALRLIKRKGALATYSRKAGARVKNPVTQQETVAGENQTWELNTVGLPPGRSWSFRNPTLIIDRMEELHVAPQGYVPNPGDTVAWKGSNWEIKDMTVYDPDGKGPVYFRVLAGQ
jgi:hypothetical protein